MSRLTLCVLIPVASALGQHSALRTAPVDPHGAPAAAVIEVGRVEDLAPTAARRASGGSDLTLAFVSVNQPPEGDSPTEMVFTSDGARIIVAHRDSMNLIVFDAATRAVLDTIPVSGSPNSLAITSDDATLVTANLFEDTASIVDLASGTETATVVVGTQPGVVRIAPDDSVAVVGNTLDETLAVIDLSNNMVINTIPNIGFAQTTSFGDFGITYSFTDYVFGADNVTLVMPDLFNDTIRIIDLVSGVSMELASAPAPATAAISEDRATAVVAHSFPESRLTVVDIAGESITKTIPTGASATAVPPVVLSTDAVGKAVVAVQNNVRVIDLVTDAVSADLFTGTPNALGRSADGSTCVVSNFSGSLIDFATGAIVNNVLDTTTPDLLAVSPADARAATAHILRKEMLEVFNVAGAGGFFEDMVPTGPPPEGDKARNVAVSADGTTAVVINNHSHNATIMDLPSLTVTGVATAGARPGAVAITPDGTTAVVANLDSPFVSVIDLAGATTTDIAISRRGGQVAIAPDGSHAYIPVVADGDGVWRIDLDTLTVAGPKILTGNMGGIGFIFDQASGMALSHDGATLVTCGSFDNDVSVIDTVSWQEVARVPVGNFPVRVRFAPDDAVVYVANRNDASVTVVTNAGAASAAVDTIAVGEWPWEMALDSTGATLYVANFLGKSVSVVDTASGAEVAVIPIPETNGGGEPVGVQVFADDSRLAVAANGADYHLIDTATNMIVDTLNTGLAPAMLVVNDVTGCGHMPSPLGGDGLSIVCPASTPCLDLADCADTNGDGIRDDNCVWWACDRGACLATDIVFGDMGGQFGDCPPDGTADGNDRFQALNCFGNVAPGGGPYTCEAAPPAAFNVDTGGQFGACQPDGVCDGNDAFAALNAFADVTSCSCPLDGGPMPTVEPLTVGKARLTLSPARRQVAPGSVFSVDVHLATPLADLRGYQLHVGVRGGDSGTLRLVDLAIEDRPPAGASAPSAVARWRAFNRATAQLLAGMDEPGIPVDAGYLATLTFVASPDAAGRFAIELLHDDDDATQRTYLFATAPHHRLAIDSSRTTVDVVERGADRAHQFSR